MKKVIFTLITLISFSNFLKAQDSDFRNWGAVNINQKINDKLSLSSDLQYRTFEDLDQLNQLLLRGGIGYNLSENNNTILAGYAFVLTRVPIGENEYTTFNENRFYQQFNTKHAVSRVGLNHRFRFEERLMNDDIYFRFRYQFTATLPINKTKLEKDAWFVKASNEIFLNTIKQNNFDRNRLNFALGYVISPKLTVEAGYMKQHVQHQQTNHLQLGLTINNPINKKPS